MKKFLPLFKTIIQPVFMFLAIIMFGQNAFGQTIVVTNPPTPWTVPQFVTSVKIQCWGGGGGGAGNTVSSPSGSGGGGGAYATLTFTVTGGQLLYSSLGSGGAGGTAISNAGKAGGITWLNTSNTQTGALVLAVGGGGGVASSTTGISGGSASACTPTAGAFSGGTGGPNGSRSFLGVPLAAGGGSGGSSAGTAANGTKGSQNSTASTNGGVAPTGGGNGGISGYSPVSGTVTAPGPGFNPGGGGGGASSLSLQSGGNGYTGQIIITYTIPPPTITVGAITGSPFCTTSSQTTPTSISVPITINGTFASGNIFTAQLSNASGSFASPVTLGSTPLSGTMINISTTISGIIPVNTVAGIGYLVQVTATSPTTTSTNTIPITIYTPQANSIAPSTAQTINTISPGNGTLLTVTDGSGATATGHQWYYGSSSSGPFSTMITGATGTTYTPSNSTFSTAGTYWVVCVSAYPCSSITSNAVQITAVIPAITTGTITGSPFCATASGGSTINVPFTSTGNFSGNTYTAQLSDALGSFASPVNIGTLSSASNSGTISATIPNGTPSGPGYLVHVISSSPAVVGSSNGPITINLSSNSIAPASNQSYAAGASGSQLAVTDQPVAATSWQWYWSSNSGAGPYIAISGATSSTYTPSNINNNVAGVYYIVCVSTFACGTTASNQVQATVTPGAMANLQISTIASPQTADAYFTPSFTLTGRDVYGNLVNGGSVSITYSGGASNTPAITLGSNGSATVSNFAVYQAGTNVTLTVTSAANSNVFNQSNAFNVNAFASSAGDYFRNNSALAANSDWSSVPTWQGSHDGANWYAATAVPTNTANAILIQPQAGGFVTISTSTITGTNITVTGELDINSSGILAISGASNLLSVTGIVNINSGGTLSNTGTGTITSSAGTLFANPGGTFQHAVNGGAIPVATWDRNSTCIVSGVSSIAPTGLGQIFGNFTWKSTLTANVSLNSVLTTVTGDFTFSPSSSTGILSLATDASLALNIGGNFVVSAAAGSVLQLSSGSASPVITISGTFSHSGGTIDFGSGSGIATLDIDGNFTISGSSIITGSSHLTGTINFFGAAASLTNTTSNAPGYANFFINNGVTASLQSPFAMKQGSSVTVLGGGTLVCAANQITDDGSCTFNLNSTGTLQIGSVYGITAATTGSIGGNVQASARNFSGGANYIYSSTGTSPYSTGNGLPTSLTDSLTISISNTSIINLTQTTSIGSTGKLLLANGSFASTSNLALDNGSTIVRDNGSLSSVPAFSALVNVTYANLGFNTLTQTTGNELPVSNSTLGNLTINKAGANITLGANAYVNSSLNLTNGIFSTSQSQMLTLNSAASVNGGSNSPLSFVNGPLTKIGIPLSPGFTFPIGAIKTASPTFTGYVPVALTKPAGQTPTAADVFTAQYFQATGGASNLGWISPAEFSTGITRVSSCDYWTITAPSSNYPTGMDVTLTWDDNINGCAGLLDYVNDASTLAIEHFSNGTGYWDSHCSNCVVNANNTGIAPYYPIGSITWSAATNFSPFSLASTSIASNPLPILLDYFTATKETGYNKLIWKAECANALTSFVLERSADGLSFSGIDSVSVDNAPACSLPFIYNDRTSNSPKSFYRVKITDASGNYSYSETRLILNSANSFELLGIYPNPATNTAWLNISSSQSDRVNIVIMSIDGKELQRNTVQVLAGESTINLKVAGLAKGVYMIKVIFSSEQGSTIKLIKQ